MAHTCYRGNCLRVSNGHSPSGVHGASCVIVCVDTLRRAEFVQIITKMQVRAFHRHALDTVATVERYPQRRCRSCVV